MQFFITRAAFIAAAASLVAANPVAEVEGQTLAKRDISYGNPHLVTDQGNQFKLNFGSTSGHPNACPGHYICYIPKNGNAHGDVSLGNPDDFVDEGARWVSVI
ncbi:putative effector protein [Ceratobasidium theobromae]|uniref:Putative effector protein n=1 Tax=Ceratobasidium theobromae TaxID=1582974 RepID=A0A5N5QF83_9AGAM|nr:putative effector protein [Ceratobasidium theobromae]